MCAAHCGAHVSILLQDDDDGATARTREVGPRRVGRRGPTSLVRAGGGAREGRGAEKPALFGSESDERIQKQVVSGGQEAVGDVGAEKEQGLDDSAEFVMQDLTVGACV